MHSDCHTEKKDLVKSYPSIVASYWDIISSWEKLGEKEVFIFSGHRIIWVYSGYLFHDFKVCGGNQSQSLTAAQPLNQIQKPNNVHYKFCGPPNSGFNKIAAIWKVDAIYHLENENIKLQILKTP